MSRFDYDGEDGVPWELWKTIVSRALGGRRGQKALAAMEDALVALPEKKLIEGHLAAEGQVCAIGALVAHHRAQEQAVDIQTVIDLMGAGVKCWCNHGRDKHAEGPCSGTRLIWGSNEERPCGCDAYDPEGEDAYGTAQAGQAIGLSSTVAYHLAYLNDESLGASTPEERYVKMLAWVRRAQGKEAVAA